MVHALHNRVEHETKRTDDQTILLKIPIPTISLDVCFMGGANDARKATIWDIADSSSVSITGTQASPEAGKSSELIKKAAFKSIENLRHTRVRVKSDPEPAVVGILRYFKGRRSHETWILHSPEGSHQSNGIVETCSVRLKGMTRPSCRTLQRVVTG